MLVVVEGYLKPKKNLANMAWMGLGYGVGALGHWDWGVGQWVETLGHWGDTGLGHCLPCARLMEDRNDGSVSSYMDDGAFLPCFCFCWPLLFS